MSEKNLKGVTIHLSRAEALKELLRLIIKHSRVHSFSDLKLLKLREGESENMKVKKLFLKGFLEAKEVSRFFDVANEVLQEETEDFAENFGLSEDELENFQEWIKEQDIDV